MRDTQQGATLDQIRHIVQAVVTETKHAVIAEVVGAVGSALGLAQGTAAPHAPRRRGQ